MSAPQEYALQVLELATVTAEIALRHYRRSLDVEIKSDGSPVTIADRAAEQAARDWIDRRFPNDGILGEEFGSVRPDAPRRWIIDPIDGTKAFVRGVPLWGSLVALCEGNRVLAGAAVFPALRESITAAKGVGCYWNDSRAAVSSIDQLSAATVLTTDAGLAQHASRKRSWERLASEAHLSRTWGDCYGYLLVATGRAEAMLDPVLSAWDSAPLQPIIEEAGGVFTDWNGEQTAFGESAVATNKSLANIVRATLGVQ